MTQPRIPLEVLRIDSPCPADWNEMAGDDRKRFCKGCQKHVYDLSAMSRSDAERLVCESAGNLCARMAREADGTMVTVEYQHSTRARARRGWRFWTGLGLAGALFTGVVEAVTGKSPLPPSISGITPPPPPRTQMLMGAICPPSMPPPAVPTTPPAPPVSQSNLDPPAPPSALDK